MKTKGSRLFRDEKNEVVERFFFGGVGHVIPQKGDVLFGGISPITTRQFSLLFCACLIASRHDTKMDAKAVGLLHYFVR